jgi:hypothetical protein
MWKERFRTHTHKRKNMNRLPVEGMRKATVFLPQQTLAGLRTIVRK